MECEICQRTHDESLNFFCAACARNAAYLPRLQHAQTLLEGETLRRKVEEAVAVQQPSDSGGERIELSGVDRKGLHTWLKEKEVFEARRRLQYINEVRQQVAQESTTLKAHIHELKDKIAERRRILSIANSVIPQRHESHINNLVATYGKTSLSLQQIQQRSAKDRASLCREAALLMRLRQRRKQRDIPVQYSIAQLTLPDLREISNIRCADLTAVLGSVSHLVLLVAFYLGIRLPAEIVAPLKDHPLPTINTPSGSYTGKEAEFTGTHNQPPTTSSSSLSKYELGVSLKSRPLFIGSENRDERVFNFQKNDPQGFNYFVEGIALLAWDVAWLCRSQGFTAGTNSWEEICNIGRNLHQLLNDTPLAPSMSRARSERILPKRPVQIRKSSTPQHEGRKEAIGKLGHNSDLSSIVDGTKAPQMEALKSWDFILWNSVASPLRKILLVEIASAEWEVLQEEEFDDGGEQFDEAVLVKTRVLDGQQYDDARSIMAIKARAEEDTAALGRIPGTSGWTKLKSREKV